MPGVVRQASLTLADRGWEAAPLGSMSDDVEGWHMRRISLTYLLAGTLLASGAFAQNAAQPNGGAQRPGPTSGNQVQAPSPDQAKGKRSANAQDRRSADTRRSATETRPAAKYPHPSGQDSQPDNSSGKTVLAAPGSKKDKESGHERAPAATRQSKQADQLARQKTYTESSGSKADPSTACTTARPTVNGGVDCGMSGNSATQGKVVTKPH